MYYEATILSLNVDSDLAYVRFDYYENEEEVSILDLLSVECKNELEVAYTEEGEHEEEEEESVNQNNIKTPSVSSFSIPAEKKRPGGVFC